MKTALVVGGSGLVGRFCLQALLGDPAYNSVVSIARRELQVHDPKLVQKVTPFETLASLQLPTVDDVFCALGTTIRKAGSQTAFLRVDYEYPLMVADHALRFGAKQFMLVSSVGADPKSKNFYLRTKGELEQALRRLPFKTLHIFRPSFLMGPREESFWRVCRHTAGQNISVPADRWVKEVSSDRCANCRPGHGCSRKSRPRRPIHLGI